MVTIVTPYPEVEIAFNSNSSSNPALMDRFFAFLDEKGIKHRTMINGDQRFWRATYRPHDADIIIAWLEKQDEVELKHD